MEFRRVLFRSVFQWKPSDNLDFVLEGGYLGSREKRSVERLYVQDMPFMSVDSYYDVVLMPDGKTVKSLTITNPNGIPAGIDSQYNSFHSNLYTTNFEAHWRGRSEEHTSELQSLMRISYAVFCLKKKK